MSTATERINSIMWGDERNDKDDLLSALKKVAAEWQKDKDELDRLHKSIESAPCWNPSLIGEYDKNWKECGCTVCMWKRKTLKETK